MRFVRIFWKNNVQEAYLIAWISSDYFESLLLPQLLRGENDSKQSDEFQATYLPKMSISGQIVPEIVAQLC